MPNQYNKEIKEKVGDQKNRLQKVQLEVSSVNQR
jgi:hypothetical protein